MSVRRFKHVWVLLDRGGWRDIGGWRFPLVLLGSILWPAFLLVVIVLPFAGCAGCLYIFATGRFLVTYGFGIIFSFFFSVSLALFFAGLAIRWFLPSSKRERQRTHPMLRDHLWNEAHRAAWRVLLGHN